MDFDKSKKLIPEANSSEIFTYDPPNQSLENSLQDRNVLVPVRGSKMAKCANNCQHLHFCHFLAPYRHQNITKPFLSHRGGSKILSGES